MYLVCCQGRTNLRERQILMFFLCILKLYLLFVIRLYLPIDQYRVLVSADSDHCTDH